MRLGSSRPQHQAPAQAATATPSPPTSRTHRKPFSSFMKRLAGLKTSHNHSHHNHASQASSTSNSEGPYSSHLQNNLYKSNSGPDASGSISHSGKHRSNSHPSIHIPLNTSSTVYTLTGSPHDDSKNHNHTYHHRHNQFPSTVSESSNSSPSSIPKPSNHTMTTATTSLKSPSTFSSPAPSVRSLTTTLTTIQSTAPNLGNGTTSYNPHPSHHHNPYSAPVLFTNPLPSPPHLHPSSTTPGSSNNHVFYSSATANGLLTDNASIITLASSSKRRRRHSFDTDASILALAPASLWGSRESLPVSVLSSIENADRATTGSIRMPGDRSSLYGRLGGDGSSIRGINPNGVASPTPGGQGSGEYPSQGKENYCAANLGNAGAGGSTPTIPTTSIPTNGHTYWEGSRNRRSSGLGEVHADGEECRHSGEGVEVDDASTRSTRTASIRSGKTETTEEEPSPVGESGVVAIGACPSPEPGPSPAPVVLNTVMGGKGKEKM